MWHDHEYDAVGLKAELTGYFENIELLHMGGKQEVLSLEIQRTRKMAWLTLPVTLPFVPDAIRIAALRSLKWLAGQNKQKSLPPMCDFPFDESDLMIASDVTPSVNLIAVARKS
jgi:hypothetical protein